jgi:hypothetical protein
LSSARHVDDDKLYKYDVSARTPGAELALSPEVENEHRILNGTCSVEAGNYGEEVKSTFRSWTPRCSTR